MEGKVRCHSGLWKDANFVPGSRRTGQTEGSPFNFSAKPGKHSVCPRIRPPAGVLSAVDLISSVDADCLPIAFLLDWKHDTRGIHGQTSTDPGGISR